MIIVRTNAFQVEHDYMKAVVRLIRIDKIIEIDEMTRERMGKQSTQPSPSYRTPAVPMEGE